MKVGYKMTRRVDSRILENSGVRVRYSCRNSGVDPVPVWKAPEMLSSDSDGAQASTISPSGSKCSSSQETSRRERCNFDGIRVNCLAIVEEHPLNERRFNSGRSRPLSPI